MAYFCCFQYDLFIFVCIQIGVQDIATRVIAEGLRVEQTIISKIMTRNPIYVMSDTPAIEALQKMVQGMSSDSCISFDRVHYVNVCTDNTGTK
jgi:CBS domain-containing protein